jgi:NTP pyrophosphatase (non-canonical NTP hydrolase)
MNEPGTLPAAQERVDASVKAAGGYWPPLANLARLFEECGELARAINQSHGPKVRKAGEAPRELALELGDVLYVTLVLANSLDLDAGEALAASIEKVERRNREHRASADESGPE